MKFTDDSKEFNSPIQFAEILSCPLFFKPDINLMNLPLKSCFPVFQNLFTVSPYFIKHGLSFENQNTTSRNNLYAMLAKKDDELSVL